MMPLPGQVAPGAWAPVPPPGVPQAATVAAQSASAAAQQQATQIPIEATQVVESQSQSSPPEAGSAARAGASAAPASTPRSQRKRRTAGPPKVCCNCGTTSTPFWRKDKNGMGALCNACGLYSAKNDAHRPKLLWKTEEEQQQQPAAAVGAVKGKGRAAKGRVKSDKATGGTAGAAGVIGQLLSAVESAAEKEEAHEQKQKQKQKQTQQRQEEEQQRQSSPTWAGATTAVTAAAVASS